MKYTAEDRALAIHICQIAASSDLSCTNVILYLDEPISEAHTLVFEARRAVDMDLDFHCRGFDRAALDRYGLSCAEAECLLREGWSPGEPVKRIGGAS